MPLLASDANSNSIQVLKHGTTQTVSFSGNTASATTSLNKGVYRIVSSADCHFSLTGTATTSDALLPQSAIEFVRVAQEDTISFIHDSNSGTVYVTEMV